MDDVSGQRDCLYTGAIWSQNMRVYGTGQVRVLVTQLQFVNHYVLFGVRRGDAERSRIL